MKRSAFIKVLAAFIPLLFISCQAMDSESEESDSNEKDDFLPPSTIEYEKALAGDGSVLLSWLNPSDKDFYAAEITFSSPSYGKSKTILVKGQPNQQSCYQFSALKNGEEYSFEIVCLDNNLNRSEVTSKKATPNKTQDITPPAEVSDIQVTGGDSEVLLSWTNPTDEDFYAVEIVATPPEGSLEKSVIVLGEPGEEESFNVTSLTNETEYTFTVWTIDTSLNKSKGKNSSSVTPHKSESAEDGKSQIAINPQDVENFSAENKGDGILLLSWDDIDDKNIFGYEVNYNDSFIMVSPGTECCYIHKLTKDTFYTFTIKSVYKAGLLSQGKLLKAYVLPDNLVEYKTGYLNEMTEDSSFDSDEEESQEEKLNDEDEVTVEEEAVTEENISQNESNSATENEVQTVDPEEASEEKGVKVQGFYSLKEKISKTEFELLCLYKTQKQTGDESNDKDSLSAKENNSASLLSEENPESEKSLADETNSESKENESVEGLSWYDAILYSNLRSMAENLTPVYIINGSSDPAKWSKILSKKVDKVKKYMAPETKNDSWDILVVDKNADGYRLPTRNEQLYMEKGEDEWTFDYFQEKEREIKPWSRDSSKTLRLVRNSYSE